MSRITTSDGTEIFYKDWGSGPPIVFSHGWPLCSDAWDVHMVFLASRGYRCIAHDRRGHGRSSQPSEGNDLTTYASDLAALLDELDVRDATLVGHSTGGGEVVRYIGRYGTGRVARAVLVGAIPPLLMRTDANPSGVPKDVFDQIRVDLLADRSRYYTNLTVPFFSSKGDEQKVSKGVIRSFWFQSMLGGLKNHYECITAFSETDLTEDLRRIDVPTLVVHGDDDQIVPIEATAYATVKLVPDAKLLVYEGASHGLPMTHADRLCQDILDFVSAPSRRTTAQSASAPV